MKIFVVTGEYTEDGTYVVAARDAAEVREVMRNYTPSYPGAEPYDTWQDDFSASELIGASVDGAPQILWP